MGSRVFEVNIIIVMYLIIKSQVTEKFAKSLTHIILKFYRIRKENKLKSCLVYKMSSRPK